MLWKGGVSVFLMLWSSVAGLGCIRRSFQEGSHTNVVNGSELPMQGPLSLLRKSVVALVGLDSEGKFTKSFCTGTFVTPRLILTAAHCFPGGEDRFGFRFRVFVGDALPHGTFFKAREFASVPSSWHYRDQAWVLLQEAVPSALPLRLWKPNNSNDVSQELPAGTEVMGIGYGRTTPYEANTRDVGDPGTLHFVPLLVSEALGMVKPDDMEIRQNYVVVRGKSTGQSVCLGDSGGPLLLQRDSSFFVVGTVFGGDPQRIPRPALICDGEGQLYNLSGSFLEWLETSSGEKILTNDDSWNQSQVVTSNQPKCSSTNLNGDRQYVFLAGDRVRVVNKSGAELEMYPMEYKGGVDATLEGEKIQIYFDGVMGGNRLFIFRDDHGLIRIQDDKVSKSEGMSCNTGMLWD